MNDESNFEPLKSMIVIKNRATFRELGEVNIDNLTAREKVLMRIINDLEGRLDSIKGNAED